MHAAFLPAAPFRPSRAAAPRGVSRLARPPPLRNAGRRRAACLRMAAVDGGGGGGGGGGGEKPRDAKAMMARYGGAYLGTSVVMSLATFGMLYALISFGVDVRAGIQALGDWLAATPLGRPKELDGLSDEMGTAALAYVANKAISPIRFPPTLVATEIVAKALGKSGAEGGEAGDAGDADEK